MDIILNGKNFIGSEVGLLTKSMSLPTDFATYVVENGRKIVKAGTIVTTPYYGLVFQDADITDEEAIASVMVGGYYIDANLPATAAAYVTNFAAQGLFPLVEGVVTLPDYGVNEASTLFSVDARAAVIPIAMADGAGKANNDLITVNSSYNVVEVLAPLDDLTGYTSSDSTQAALGDVNWLGILINTNEPTIVGIKYGNYTFAQADVDEAAAVGGVAGEFILWIVADTVAVTPKEFTLTKTNGTINMTVNVTDTSN